MPKAEVGSTKYLSNRMKSRGLQRLRWYCQLCERQMRDENAFKMHCQSEGHTRKALVAGEDFKGVQEDFSQAFLREFIQLLKTAHREKAVHVNKFYNEFIQNKSATHMNSTRWHSLTDFAKYLGRESICRVEEKDDGLYIAWIDDSPEAMKRREALRRKELQDRGDEEREQMLLQEQIRRAQRDAESRGAPPDDENGQDGRELKRQEGEVIKLSFGGAKQSPKPAAPPGEDAGGGASGGPPPASGAPTGRPDPAAGDGTGEDEKEAAPRPLSLKIGVKPQPQNVFKNAFSGGAKKVKIEQPKKMSEAERIMKEELERKRVREARGFRGPPNKRTKT